MRKLLLSTLILLVPGCSQAIYEQGFLRRNLFMGHDRAQLEDRNLDRLLKAKIPMPDRPRLVVIPVDTGYWGGPADPALDVAKRFARQLAKTAPGWQVRLAAHRLSAAPRPTSRTIEGVRSIAARYQSDFALIVGMRFSHGSGGNFLSPLYLGLVTALFVPGTRLETKITAEALLVDVRTGIIVSEASALAAERKGFVVGGFSGNVKEGMDRRLFDKSLPGFVAEVADGYEARRKGTKTTRKGG